MLKLVRMDDGLTPPAGSKTSILLPIGIHPFGRGIFLDCEDKRISRQHGHLEVSEDSVMLKALHLNPCFVIKKGSDKTQILRSGSSQSLACGDKFGLLPNTHWYELTKAEEPSDPAGSGSNTEEYASVEVKKENGEELIDFPFDDNMEERQETGSPSLLQQENGQRADGTAEASSNNPDDELIIFPDEAEEPNAITPGSPSLLGQNTDTAPSPTMLKRPHSLEADTSPAKQTRTEDQATGTEDVKPSTSALDAAMAAATQAPVPAVVTSASVKKEVKDEPASPPSPPRQQIPVAPVAPGRERCMYGAQCYRRNAQHKLAFSHPSDADWGAGAQGVCPWGAGCTRRDTRHWRDHTHPPGVAPPAAPGSNRGPPSVVVRHGATFYINAHSVHFHDDHFSVEDSDGDSVDYDYEF